ncbi:twitching motility protein PilT [Leifsonia sp. 98AMF]|uniref:type IV pilus twitching motility protein PilT n=1 Tax=unclassified Leifsonia TaxID=2663824 RepID=UPI00087D63F8|nr:MULTISPECIES: type IV pilus twitching motility protein PilT [unclassified Leifsonia]SDH57989.1 twitching motility protein PilT [Leifsonia sp. 197AMF]SDI81177.1 twitching motility protein PilT [Leifsonia sp. 466MF]SDK03830.1 twitching motility protein PilT [Leifsonia sp. 157MF]SDN84366.1 twitching motility protein PilT [Leifsonia sp. 509MF]SEN22402.1 twitching motility protein PilT [Leifsonia sp. 467MF]
MTNDDSWGGFPPPTAKPVYEIPVTPPGATAAGWTPGPGAPLSPPPTWTPAATTEPASYSAPEPAAYEAHEPEPTASATPAPQPVTPVWSLDDPAPAPAPVAPATPVTRLIPAGRRAAAPAPEVEREKASRPFIPDFDEGLTDPEREALERADKDLVAALHEVVYQRASDLHITVGAPPMVRVDGGLRAAASAEPWNHDRTRTALTSLLTERQLQQFEREHELDFAFTISANSRFRVNLYQQRGSYGGAFRLIPTEIKQLGDLGVPESVGQFAQLPRGLVLVTGPTGSGKSTTLAALIDLVNSTRSDHIVTVEDPIEFMHVHKKSIVNQREVGHDTHSFNNALKHVLRQDPDVILIGELRDLETISVALTAAETGHLVFATLHTQDAPQTIDRVIDVFPPHQQDQVRAQLAGTLQGVVSQTLLKRASGKGRVVATEILIMTPAIANVIREGKTYQIASMMQAGRESGMRTMDQHLAELVNAGVITRRAAVDKAHDKEGIARLIQRVDSPTEASAMAIAASGPDFGDSYSGTVG